MVRLLKQLISGEKGQALAITLGLLALGGLTIAVSLNYATTSLKGSGIVEEKMEGIYAAGAGVEYALWALTTDNWSIADGDNVTTELSENINEMTAGIVAVNEGIYTLYLGELIEAGPPAVHVEFLDVTGNITDLGGGVYQYTVTATLVPGPNNLNLSEVGARLPVGYTYQAGSAALFAENLSTDEPTSNTTDQYGAYLPTWVFGNPNPKLTSDNATKSQIFYITGTGSTDGAYACVEGDPASVGKIGEIKGTRYSITATATRPEDGRTTAEIVIDDIIVIGSGGIEVLSWEITK